MKALGGVDFTKYQSLLNIRNDKKFAKLKML